MALHIAAHDIQRRSTVMTDFFYFSNELFCLADTRGYFVRVNPAWTTTLGWTERELLERPYVEFVHPDDRESTLREAGRLLDSGYQTIQFENRYRCRDGSYRWLAWMSRRVLDGQIVATARDVTEQKKQADELRTSEERLRLVMQATSDAIWDVDLIEKTVWCNDVFETAFGLPRRHAGDSWDWWIEFIHPGDQQRVVGSLQDKMAGTEDRWNCEYRYRKRDGSYAHVFNRALLARDANGKVTRVLGAMQDITERKQAEEKLRQKAAIIRQLFILQEEELKLTADDIHDGLAQKIIGASLYLEGTRHRISDEELPAFPMARQLIREAINQARQLITDLRPMIIDEGGITKSVQHAIAEWNKVSTCQFSLVSQIEREKVDALFNGVVFRIIQELVNNALRHAEPQQIDIDLRQTATDFHITIRDDGRGFDLGAIPEERFGIRGVVERAEMFQGQAHWETTPGQGTTVTVTMRMPPEDE